MIKATKLVSRVTSKKYISPKVIRVDFEHVTPLDFDFEPGQYVNVMVADKTLRAYSICSGSSDKRHFSLIVDVEHEGKGANFFRQVELGQEVTMIGPSGTFTLRTPLPPSITFFATGTGIAPFVAMLDKLEREHYEGKCKLFFGIRTEDELLVKPQYSWLTTTVFVSRPKKADLPAGWVTGRVTKALESKDYEAAHYYLCGNPNMINEITAALKKSDVPEENIFCEEFKVSEQAPQPLVGPSGFEPETFRM